MGQRKAFYKQKNPEFNCARKQIIDRNIFLASRNGDRKIMQSMKKRVDLLDNKEVEPVEPLQMNIYQINIYRKSLSWLHFEDEPRGQDRHQVKEKQPYISVFIVYLTTPSNNWEYQLRHDNIISCMIVWCIYRNADRPQRKETSWTESRLQFYGRQF